MTNEETMEVFDGLSHAVPLPSDQRWYRTPRADDSQALLKVRIDKQGDALIAAEALDVLLRIAGFQEVPVA